MQVRDFLSLLFEVGSNKEPSFFGFVCRNLLSLGLEFFGDFLVNGILCLSYFCLLVADRGFAVRDIGFLIGDLLFVLKLRCFDKGRRKRFR